MFLFFSFFLFFADDCRNDNDREKETASKTWERQQVHVDTEVETLEFIMNEKFSCYHFDVSTKIGIGIMLTNGENHISFRFYFSSPGYFLSRYEWRNYCQAKLVFPSLRLLLLSSNAISWFVSRSGRYVVSFNKNRWCPSPPFPFFKNKIQFEEITFHKRET